MGLQDITTPEDLKRLKGKPIYSAVFLTEESHKFLMRSLYQTTSHTSPLANVKAHHVTLEFKPSDISDLPVGEEVELKVVGMAMDEDCHAIVVELPEGLSCANKHPHITVSHSNEVTPKYSNELLERGFSENVGGTLQGVVGVFGKVQ